MNHRRGEDFVPFVPGVGIQDVSRGEQMAQADQLGEAKDELGRYCAQNVPALVEAVSQNFDLTVSPDQVKQAADFIRRHVVTRARPAVQQLMGYFEHSTGFEDVATARANLTAALQNYEQSQLAVITNSLVSDSMQDVARIAGDLKEHSSEVVRVAELAVPEVTSDGPESDLAAVSLESHQQQQSPTELVRAIHFDNLVAEGVSIIEQLASQSQALAAGLPNPQKMMDMVDRQSQTAMGTDTVLRELRELSAQIDQIEAAAQGSAALTAGLTAALPKLKTWATQLSKAAPISKV